MSTFTYWNSQSFRTLTHWQSGDNRGDLNILELIKSDTRFYGIKYGGEIYHNLPVLIPVLGKRIEFNDYDNNKINYVAYQSDYMLGNRLFESKYTNDWGVTHYGAIIDIGELQLGTTLIPGKTKWKKFWINGPTKDGKQPDPAVSPVWYTLNSTGTVTANLVMPIYHQYLVTAGWKRQDIPDTVMPDYYTDLKDGDFVISQRVFTEKTPTFTGTLLVHACDYLTQVLNANGVGFMDKTFKAPKGIEFLPYLGVSDTATFPARDAGGFFGGFDALLDGKIRGSDLITDSVTDVYQGLNEYMNANRVGAKTTGSYVSTGRVRQNSVYTYNVRGAYYLSDLLFKFNSHRTSHWNLNTYIGYDDTKDKFTVECINPQMFYPTTDSDIAPGYSYGVDSGNAVQTGFEWYTSVINVPVGLKLMPNVGIVTRED